MMFYFCEVSTIWQIILLVLTLITVIILSSCCILSFRNRYNTKKQYGMNAVLLFLLLLNTALYVLMQVDSRITGTAHFLHLPYILVFIGMLVSFCVGVWSVLRETKNRKTINNTSIKESFDNLPTGVCFFNEEGLPVLCNREMHRFSFAVSGKDVQFFTDLDDMLDEDYNPFDGAVKAGKIFTLKNGRAWQLEKREVINEMDGIYIQFIASDVTDLQRNRVKLTEENNQLHQAQAELKKLSANIVAITREEEILNTKMRVHDEMGRCLMEAGKYLSGKGDVPGNLINSWKKAVSILEYNNATEDEDMLLQICQTCESFNLSFVQKGTLPKDETIAYILTCAIRECVTNAIRYTGADELNVVFAEDESFASVTVTNNGKQPESQIKEGGGLSTLRRRVERTGGVMTIQSFPSFKLTVTVPKRKDGVL